MVDVWDTASHLFSVADRDRSGDVDALEFRDALESFIEKVSPPPPLGLSGHAASLPPY